MKRLTRASKRAHNEEHGLAIASVAILGAFLVMLTVVVMLRSMTEQTLTRDDRLFEQSLHTAEASVDYALAEFIVTPTFNTTQTSAAVDTREEVVTAALDIYNAPGSGIPVALKDQAVHETGEGVSIVVKPFDADVVYGVGFSPSVESYQAGVGKVRVVVSELGAPYWTPEQAVLVGGPLKVEAKKDDKDIELIGDGGWVHANGEVEFKDDKNSDNLHGCLTAYGNPDTVFKDNGDDRKDPDKTEGPYTNNVDNPPSAGVADCPDLPSDVEYVPVPLIDPMNVHHLAHYEICPDGLRWGPNATKVTWYSGQTASLRGFPCTGDEITEFTPGVPVSNNWVLGIKNVKEVGKSATENWDKRAEFEKDAVDGVFFSWGRSVKLKKLKNEGDRYWTIIAAKGDARMKAFPNTPLFNDLTCQGKGDAQVWNPNNNTWEDLTKENYGDVEVEIENDDLYPHPDGKGYTIVTAGDVKLKIKGKKDLPDPGEMHGVIALHEQFKIESSDVDSKGAFYGAVVAEDACDTKDSLHNNKISEFKKGDIVYDADFKSSDFVLEDVANGEYRLLSQSEM